MGCIIMINFNCTSLGRNVEENSRPVVPPAWYVCNIPVRRQGCDDGLGSLNFAEGDESFASAIQSSRDGSGSLGFTFSTDDRCLSFLFSLEIEF